MKASFNAKAGKSLPPVTNAYNFSYVKNTGWFLY